MAFFLLHMFDNGYKIKLMTDQGTIIPFRAAHNNKSSPQSTFFERTEFEAILNIYGKMVASGNWKDYAVSATKENATFAVFQKASERPIFRIIKTPSLRNKQGAYAILSSQGQVLKRGQELKQLLNYFEKKLIKLVK